MSDNTIARIPVSLKKQDQDALFELRDKLETRNHNGKRLTLAAVVREAIYMALAATK